jgi:hypothetical protein
MFPLVDEIPILLPRKLINHQPVGEGVKAPEFETSESYFQMLWKFIPDEMKG